MIEYLVGLRAGSHLTSPLRQYYLTYRAVSSDYLQSLSGLSVIADLTREFIGSASQTPRLTDFTRFIRLNRELGRPIVNESWFISGEAAIMLLTVHKAKGLEFDSVYLIDAIENEWQPRHIGRKPPANLPMQPYGEHFDDYARLAYVAATRARRSFIVSSYSMDLKGQPLLASPLFNGLALSKLPPKLKSYELTLAALENSLSWPKLSSSDTRALLKERLDNFSLNATGLVQFLNVADGGPQHFLEQQLLRLPELKTDYMAYGTAMHAALQAAQNMINQGVYSFKAVLGEYQSSLSAQQLPNTSLERFISHGQKILGRLLNELKYELPKGGQAEVNFEHLTDSGVAIKGTFDHLYKEAKSLIISDYKTGTPLKSFSS